jgi:amino acid transporter
VAHENLGTSAGLTAAVALMVDYVTTVAVSVTAGMQAVTAFVPFLYQYRLGLDVTAIAVLVIMNLRGVREAGAAFVLPTYIFIGSLALLLVWGPCGSPFSAARRTWSTRLPRWRASQLCWSCGPSPVAARL